MSRFNAEPNYADEESSGNEEWRGVRIKHGRRCAVSKADGLSAGSGRGKLIGSAESTQNLQDDSEAPKGCPSRQRDEGDVRRGGGRCSARLTVSLGLGIGLGG